MIKTLRARLTIWYLIFFSCLLLFFSLFVYGALSRALRVRMDDTIEAQAGTAASLFRDELEEMHGAGSLAATETVREMSLRGTVLAVLSDGRVLATNAERLAPVLAEIGRQAAGAGGLTTVASYSPHGARAIVHPVDPYSILVLEPMDAIDAQLALIRDTLLLALPLLIALAGTGGYVLAGRSLAGLDRMADQARRISGNNLETRLEIGEAAAELTMLAGAFNELLSRLDQSFETMRRFVADAAHELRTPIAIIRGEADVALEHPRSAETYRDTLAVIQDESRRLTRLVDDLLNLARADAGHVRLSLQDFYISDVVAECCRSMYSLAAAKSITLEHNAPEDVTFRGDEELLRRLLLNLLDNAIRYTPPGGRVTATLEAAEYELRLSVADTGAGIPPETAPYIFDRFFRGDKARARQNGGFGLGLAIVKWVAESHRGEVQVVSTPGKGSTFTVTLPCSRVLEQRPNTTPIL
jgi:heavy metal sensor kinase